MARLSLRLLLVGLLWGYNLALVKALNSKSYIKNLSSIVLVLAASQAEVLEDQLEAVLAQVVTQSEDTRHAKGRQGTGTSGQNADEAGPSGVVRNEADQ